MFEIQGQNNMTNLGEESENLLEFSRFEFNVNDNGI